MNRLKNIMFVKDFSANLKLINQVVTTIVIILTLLLIRVLVYAVSEQLDMAIKIAIFCSALILFLSLIAFRFYYVRSINKIADHANRYNSLLAITRELHLENNITALCSRILEYSISQTDAEAGAVHLFNGQSCEPVSFRGVTDKPGSISPDGGLSGICLSDTTIVRVDDITQDSRFSAENDSLSNARIRSFMCLPIKGTNGPIGVIKLSHSDPAIFTKDDEEACEYIATLAAISIENSRFRTDHENFEQHMTGLLLQAMDNHLPVKVEHARRVEQYSRIIATGMKMAPEQQKTLYSACLLHDVGFIKFLPNEEMEREKFLKHAALGSALLDQINFYKQESKIVLHHHERFDGQGYPAMLKGHDIPIESRIIAIAEVFDAITSSDSYKKPLSFSEALEEMKKNSGTQFDPVLLDVFVNNIGEIL